MPPPLLLCSWPYVVVRIDCVLCPRKGRYRLARLAVRYGPDFEMDRLLAHVAGNCPWWRSRPRKYDPRCGARFTDIERAAIPDLPAGVETDVLRRRIPPREAVPQRRTAGAPPTVLSMPMLSGWPAATIVLRCRRCGRREVYEVAALLKDGDRRLTDVSWQMRADCPRREVPALHERCDVYFEPTDPPPGAPAMRLAGE